MKAAFHFLAEHPTLPGNYGRSIRKKVLSCLLRNPAIELETEVAHGDLLLLKQIRNGELTVTGNMMPSDVEPVFAVAELLLGRHPGAWQIPLEEVPDALVDNEIFVLTFETMKREQIAELHRRCARFPWYLGWMQVNDLRPIHDRAYAKALVPMYRLAGRHAFLFWDGLSEDSMSGGELEELKAIGFEQVDFQAKLPPFFSRLSD